MFSPAGLVHFAMGVYEWIFKKGGGGGGESEIRPRGVPDVKAQLG